MMTWLKKYGLTILKDAAIVLGIGSQAIEQIDPNSAKAASVGDTLTKLAAIVTDTEAGAAAIPGGLTGPQKLAAAAALANQELQDWFKNNLPGSPSVQTQALWEAGVTGIVNGLVALLNSAEPNVATAAGVRGSAVPLASSSSTPASPAK